MNTVGRLSAEKCWLARDGLTWCLKQETLNNRNRLPYGSTTLKAKIRTGLDELIRNAFGVFSVPLAEFLKVCWQSLSFRGLQKHHPSTHTLLNMPLFLRGCEEVTRYPCSVQPALLLKIHSKDFVSM